MNCNLIKSLFCFCCRQIGLDIYTEMGILQVLTDFASGTSIHGLSFIVQPQLPIWKRVAWTLFFIAAMIYATERLRIAIISKHDFIPDGYYICNFYLTKILKLWTALQTQILDFVSYRLGWDSNKIKDTGLSN